MAQNGDPDHVAYGKNWSWECSCGATGGFLTTKAKAEYQAANHRQYCRYDGNTELTESVL